VKSAAPDQPRARSRHDGLVERVSINAALPLAERCPMKILLLNAGSSSLKAALLNAAGGAVVARAMADWSCSRPRYRYDVPGRQASQCELPASGPAPAVAQFLHDLTRTDPVVLASPEDLAAVGHRIVHGGRLTRAMLITPQVESQIQGLADLAPLHNPPGLEALAAARARLPGIPHVAVFDTSFHGSLPPAACTYPLPRRWSEELGIRKYGFHGLSHAYCARRAAEMLPASRGQPRVIICHLGHGCSATAVRNGLSLDTTMGFTPLDGLMMATRSGSIDPGIVFHLQHHVGLSSHDVERALQRESGLLGVSGVSADMREVLAAAKGGHQPAHLALGIYCHRVRQAIGALAVTLGGVDALVFTAGVGENSSEIRRTVCQGLECLGLLLDSAANAAARPDCDIARPEAVPRILVIATREDVQMLHEVLNLLQNDPGSPHPNG